MAFEGYLNGTSNSVISGWIYDNLTPDLALRVEILDGDRVIATVTADLLRQDLVDAGKGNGKHAFTFTAEHPSALPMSARVVGKTWRIAPNGGHNLSHLLPMRFISTLSHPLEYGIPVAVDLQGFSAIPSSANDIETVRRLLRAYKKAIAEDPTSRNRKGDNWTEVGKAQHQEVLYLINKSNETRLASYLRDAHAKGITYGITQGEQASAILRSNPDARRLLMLTTLDCLTSLAEFVGTLDVEAPEQHGQWAENIHRDPLTVIDRLSKAIGIDLVPPQAIGSAFGILTARGVVVARDLMAAFAALRIKSLLSEAGTRTGTQGGAVCEIGGGLGGAALYSHLLGVNSYTIVDLPLICLLQGFYLITSLPSASIQLYGEEVPGAQIRLLPTFAFTTDAQPFGLLFNQDSFPEMHRDFSTGYLAAARDKDIEIILSINQEARGMQNPTDVLTVVRELVRDVGGYRMESRNRHWLKAGYTEEVYRRDNTRQVDSPREDRTVAQDAPRAHGQVPLLRQLVRALRADGRG